MWDAATGQQKHLLVTDGSFIRDIAFSPDGKWLACSDMSDAVRLWDAATGKLLYKLPGHGRTGATRVVQFSPDSRYLLSWGDDLCLRKWEVTTGKLLVEHRTVPRGLELPESDGLDRPFGTASSCGFAAGVDQFILLYAGTEKLHFFDINTGKEVRSIDALHYRTNSVALSPTGRRFAMMQYGTQWTVFDFSSGKALFSHSFTGSWGEVAFSPEGRTVAAASGDKVVLVEVASGKVRLTLDKLLSASHHLAFSPDGRLLATSQEDTTALVWDLAALAGRADAAKD